MLKLKTIVNINFNNTNSSKRPTNASIFIFLSGTVISCQVAKNRNTTENKNTDKWFLMYF